MRSAICYLSVLCAALLLPGCFAVTRTETDIYSVTQRDTTIREDAINPPGAREGGTIYPSPRTVEITRRYVQRDSLVSRYYPAFLRFGGIETASFLVPGASSAGAGNGLFGLYNLGTARRPSDSKIFGANMYRLFPYEARLRWLRDAPDWTIGSSPLESFIIRLDDNSDIDPGEYLISVVNGYLRRRFFFREEPPYIMLVPFAGLSLYPSQYLNLGATFDVGSYGGFNLRAYAGYVAGTSASLAGIGDRRDYSVSFPYLGVGISALDFVNRTEELFIEWKDHDHSALEVSGLNVDLVHSFSGSTGFNSGQDATESPLITGAIVKVATATYPLPFGDHRFFVGTSMLNIIALSGTELAYGFLPIRAGYRHDILYDELNLEPFIELTYFPTTAFHAGARTSVKVSDWIQANVVAGLVTGSIGDDIRTGLESTFDGLDLGDLGSFTTFYVGVGVGIGDVFHTPEEVLKR